MVIEQQTETNKELVVDYVCTNIGYIDGTTDGNGFCVSQDGSKIDFVQAQKQAYASKGEFGGKKE